MKEDKVDIWTVICIIMAFIILLGMGFSIMVFGTVLR